MRDNRFYMSRSRDADQASLLGHRPPASVGSTALQPGRGHAPRRSLKGRLMHHVAQHAHLYGFLLVMVIAIVIVKAID